MLYDYSKFIKTTREIVITGSITEPSDPKLFFRTRGWCPFCKSDVPLVYSKPGEFSETNAWSCQRCGWWETKYEYSDDWVLSQTLYHGILRQFQEENLNLPIQTLRRTIRKKPDILYQIHPIKMEKLVQSVFRDFFDCEVIHCGRSNDGGVDLLIIDSECPIVVQVKRRSKRTSVESVGVVRELLGATVLQNSKRAIFVTTAPQFSRNAKKAAEKAVELNVVRSFELINFKSFVQILNLVRSDNEEPWRSHI